MKTKLTLRYAQLMPLTGKWDQALCILLFLIVLFSGAAASVGIFTETRVLGPFR